ncbi:GNAT family N-acetyltransferase [Streptomyces sp. 4N509B]|uniref:GNAT family N-acetyltransferase n=1 Tax=Streptomyces sp. 4N509B TaxID=3457413 RepID=UPI003FD4FDC4
MDFVIRDATEAELDAAGELTARVYLADGLLDYGEEDPYLSELRDARRRAAHAQVMVAVDADGEVVGTVTHVGAGGAFADVSGEGEAEFRMLAVAPGARGRGVGEALVRECLRRAREAGRARVVLSSQSQMHTAHRLYHRLGFVRTPERDWKPVPELDPLQVFACELSPGRDDDHNI